MDGQKEVPTESEVKKKAYLMGLRLKNSGLDEETIYARLEKQGIPEELARQVARDTQIQRNSDTKKDIVEDAKLRYNFAFIRIGIGVVLALVSYLIFPDNVIIPVGAIGGGILSALLAKKKMEN
jgi:VIT1/CCC1 family predicted Fe2+/Mn2+ transporter